MFHANETASVYPQVFPFQCAELVPVCWTNGAGQEYSEASILAEISAGGGVFLVDEPAEPGTTIRISLPDAELEGVVRSCVGETCSFALHVDVEPTMHWFGGTYQPEVLPHPEQRRWQLPLAS